MAGGRFDKLVGKVRPGTYINFESGRENNIISTGKKQPNINNNRKNKIKNNAHKKSK